MKNSWCVQNPEEQRLRLAVWRENNRKKYNEYMKNYMRNYQPKQQTKTSVKGVKRIKEPNHNQFKIEDGKAILSFN